jgi:hypothetical protein
MNYKYLVRSGEVTSQKDVQRHFVSCKQLIELYKVKPEECYRSIIGRRRLLCISGLVDVNQVGFKRRK